MAKRTYDHLNREELIAVLKSRDAERRYGLIWEREDIPKDEGLNEDFVALQMAADLSIGDAPYANLLIEGDNFDALRFLNTAYRGGVKCIYIDPPYNTGNKDFIYNDSFLDKDDTYKHSKWLEFMYQRLSLAKDLLSEDGVIFVSIGEDEYANLTLLMDRVFPGMRVGTFVWRRRSGANDEKNWFISVDHEYVLCYANSDFSFEGEAKSFKDYGNPDGDLRGDWCNDNLVANKNFKQRPDAFYPIQNPTNDVWYPADPDNTWRFATAARLGNGKKIRTKTIETLIEEKRILWPANEAPILYTSEADLWEAIKTHAAPKNLQIYLRVDELKREVEEAEGKERARRQKILDTIPPLAFWVGKQIGFGKPRYKRFKNDVKRAEKPISTWVLPASSKAHDLDGVDLSGVETLTCGFTSEGTAMLGQMVGNKDFTFPKPLSLVKALIKQSTDPGSGHVVLDFFAGSGTTGHAVLDLNSEDNGDRRFLLVSSTEATASSPQKNVCRDQAAKRLRAAIEGYTSRGAKGAKVETEGLGGEFAYMRAQRLPMESLHMEVQHDQIWYALQMIHRQGVVAFDAEETIQRLETDYSVVLYLTHATPGVLARTRDLAEATRKATVIYSWQAGLVYRALPENQEHVKVEKIPEYLVERFGRRN